MTPEERDRVIATALGAAGHPDLAWDPAPTCPQGHPSGYQPNDKQLCWQCVMDGHATLKVTEDNRYDPTWHPEWRIGRLPKPFHTSMDLVVGALNALDLRWSRGSATGNVYVMAIEDAPWGEPPAGEDPASIADALTVCAVAVLQKGVEG